MKGNWESSAILTASAVFPLLGGPEGDGLVKLSITPSRGAGVCVLTLQQYRHQRRAVAVLRLLNQQLAVLQDHRHRVAPADDPVHDVAGVVLLIGAVCLDKKTDASARCRLFSTNPSFDD